MRLERRRGVVDPAEDLPRFLLQFVFLAGDEGDDVVDDVHTTHARVAGAPDGLQGHDAALRDGAEAGLESREGDDEADDGAV